MQSQRPFRAALLARQGSLSDGDFAALLEVNRTTWLRIRNGAWVSERVAGAAIRRWPELGPLYLAEITARRG